ncbi:hypothetical protein A6S26_20430 [Nostoc sp. ATCC 43529]|nr:hypothetical protein A6S26_20430 [Nostoc sp. ATCC 43529]
MNHIYSPINYNNQRAVICIVGTLRALDITYKNLIEKVIKPLNADLIVCVTKLKSEDEKYLKYLEKLNIIDVTFYENPKYGYENLFEEFYTKYNLKEEWYKYLNIEGNWLGGMKGRKGSGMHLNYNFWNLLKRIEYLRSKNLSYHRYVITRTDFLWLLEHPPLKLLNPNLIWIPTKENYGGYNDRHAVCSETNIDHYLSLFEYMLDLRAMNYLKLKKYCFFGKNELNHESHLKSHIDYCGVKVGRFKSVSYLTGDKDTPTNWSYVKSILIRGKEYNYKYRSELLEALKNAKNFEIHQDWNKMIMPFDSNIFIS